MVTSTFKTDPLLEKILIRVFSEMVTEISLFCGKKKIIFCLRFINNKNNRPKQIRIGHPTSVLYWNESVESDEVVGFPD